MSGVSCGRIGFTADKVILSSHVTTQGRFIDLIRVSCPNSIQSERITKSPQLLLGLSWANTTKLRDRTKRTFRFHFIPHSWVAPQPTDAGLDIIYETLFSRGACPTPNTPEALSTVVAGLRPKRNRTVVELEEYRLRSFRTNPPPG